MDPRALHPRHLLAAVAVVAAALVLAVQLISPSPVVVSMGGDGAQTTRIGQYFTYGDVAVVGVSAALLGAAGTYLLVGGPDQSGTDPHQSDGDPDRPDDRAGDPVRSADAGATQPVADGATRAATAAPERAEGAAGDDSGRATAADPRAADAADPESRREEWEAAAERLTGNEETVFRLVLDAGGELPQREIVEETDLSKATVSRTLDALEHRDLLERKRRGMGNLVTLI
ncbi:helix-turn-helix transcriptional regulator [Halosimplex halobium]|uniref:helix-turn-helix transcriptional regulator n=1 Tax=Halosimplex halobium TaxID=3396618 RepID=UPI003F56EF62